jgi:hypothetical protein
MKHFPTIEKRDPGIFSWPFLRPLSSTFYRYMVELISDSQVFQQAGEAVRQARQWSCGLCCQSETVWMPDRSEPLLLLTNKEDAFVKQGHYCLFISFIPQILIV